MKLAATRLNLPFRSRERAGFATIVVLALVFLLVVLVMANAQVLAHLKAELGQIEARQLRKTLAVHPPVPPPGEQRPGQPDGQPEP